MTDSNDGLLDRRETVAELLRDRGGLLLVCGLGGTTWDAASVSQSPLDLHLWGAMGNAAMIGLGLALAQPERPVLVVTGDGEMLMGIGALATIAVQAPGNLSILLLDNELYGETGRQPTHTGLGVDLPAMARGAGFADAETITDMAGVTAFRDRIHAEVGPRFASAKVSRAEQTMVLPERDGTLIKNRFRGALLGT
jgi:thiamine pyrophosphate-dependent acetolactate synthase large subunit-like protein